MYIMNKNVNNIDIYILIGAILGEILICQKDANKKTRDSATELLLMILINLYTYTHTSIQFYMYIHPFFPCIHVNIYVYIFI
jgi:hypothetical protein